MRFGIVGRVGDDMIEKRHWADNLKAIAEIQRRVPDVFDPIHTTLFTSPAILSLSRLKLRTCPLR